MIAYHLPGRPPNRRTIQRIRRYSCDPFDRCPSAHDRLSPNPEHAQRDPCAYGRRNQNAEATTPARFRLHPSPQQRQQYQLRAEHKQPTARTREHQRRSHDESQKATDAPPLARNSAPHNQRQRQREEHLQESGRMIPIDEGAESKVHSFDLANPQQSPVAGELLDHPDNRERRSQDHESDGSRRMSARSTKKLMGQPKVPE